ncbi:MAG: thiamine biosynthesis protein ApbE, partial [Enterovirga sp.]|nr:thiamine biosynthesis protein ApbE [Enterovirga sp.]
MTAEAAAGPRPARRVLVPPVSGPLLRPAPGPLRTLSGAAMRTDWCVTLAGRPDLPLAAVESAIGHALDLVIRQMSGWEPGSVLSRYNAAPPKTS